MSRTARIPVGHLHALRGLEEMHPASASDEQTIPSSPGPEPRWQPAEEHPAGRWRTSSKPGDGPAQRGGAEQAQVSATATAAMEAVTEMRGRRGRDLEQGAFGRPDIGVRVQ